MPNETLKKDILSTIIYYDILDYPMTAFEVWKYLGVYKKTDRSTVSLGEVMEELEGKELEKHIENCRGFYTLRGRRELVARRIEKDKISSRKMKIIRRAVFWLRFVPYVRMVAVTGTVAMKNAEGKSDLDLLIVLSHGRLFIGRTLVTALVHIMGKRRHAGKIADRVCLNCFLTGLSLESRLKDAFSASEYFFIRPLFGQKTFLQFKEENGWIGEFKNNFPQAANTSLKALPENGFSAWVRKRLEKIFNRKFFDLIEEGLEKWQTRRIAEDPRTGEAGSIIMADREALIFFHRAHGLKMEELFKKRLSDFA